MKRVILLLLLTFSSLAAVQAETIDDIREVLKYVESGHDPKAVGDYTEDGIPMSYGILQIQKNAILDVNRKYGTNYTHKDAFNIKCAEEIFELYIEMWTTHLEKKEQREATTEDIVRIWNGGPNGYKRDSTLKYLGKFKKFKYLYIVEKSDNCETQTA